MSAMKDESTDVFGGLGDRRILGQVRWRRTGNFFPLAVILLTFNFFVCIECFAWLCVHPMHACRGGRKAPDPLKRQFPIVVSRHVDVGN